MQKCKIFRSYRNINLTKELIRCNFRGFIGNFEKMTDIHTEIKFKTARSGGKGGQHVNKVETMVEGYWHVATSTLFTQDEKDMLIEKLVNKINSAGFFFVKSQVERTQLANKQLVIKKMTLLISKALVVRKKRKPTKPGKMAEHKRLESKKKIGENKQLRKKVTAND